METENVWSYWQMASITFVYYEVIEAKKKKKNTEFI